MADWNLFELINYVQSFFSFLRSTSLGQLLVFASFMVSIKSLFVRWRHFDDPSDLFVLPRILFSTKKIIGGLRGTAESQTLRPLRSYLAFNAKYLYLLDWFTYSFQMGDIAAGIFWSLYLTLTAKGYLSYRIAKYDNQLADNWQVAQIWSQVKIADDKVLADLDEGRVIMDLEEMTGAKTGLGRQLTRSRSYGDVLLLEGSEPFSSADQEKHLGAIGEHRKLHASAAYNFPRLPRTR